MYDGRFTVCKRLTRRESTSKVGSNEQSTLRTHVNSTISIRKSNVSYSAGTFDF